MRVRLSPENPTSQVILGTLGLVLVMVLSKFFPFPTWTITLGLAAFSTMILARVMAMFGLPVVLSGLVVSAFWVALGFPTPDIWSAVAPIMMCFFGLVIGTRIPLEFLRKQWGPALFLTTLLMAAIAGLVVLGYVILDHTFRLGIPAQSRELRLLYAVTLGFLAIFAAPVVNLAVSEQRRVWNPLAQGALAVATLLPIVGALVHPFFQEWALSVLDMEARAPGAVAILGRSLGLATALVLLTLSLNRLQEDLRGPIFAGLVALGIWLTVRGDAIAFLVWVPVGLALSRPGHEAIRGTVQSWMGPVGILFFLLFGLAFRGSLESITIAAALVVILARMIAVALTTARAAAMWSRMGPAELRSMLYATGSLGLIYTVEMSEITPFFQPLIPIMGWVILISTVVGAISIDWTLTRTGEDITQPDDLDERLEKQGLVTLDEIDAGLWLDSRGFRDRWLAGRVRELRATLIRSHAPVFEAVAGEHDHILSCSDEMLTRMLRLREVLNDTSVSDSEHQQRIAKIVHDFRQLDLSKANSAMISAELLHTLDEQMRKAESENRSIKVEMEDAFFVSPRNAQLHNRLVVLSRRVRRGVFGNPVRNVPIGRIWHYEMRLTTPLSLRFPLVRTTRRMASGWQHLSEVSRDMTLVLSEIQSAWVITPMERRAELRERTDEIISDLESTRDGLMRSREYNVRELATRIRDNFDNFLFAVARAGTTDWPAFRYRLSKRFDLSIRALAGASRQINRQNTIRDASVGQTRLWLTQLRFDEWYQEFLTNVTNTVERNVKPYLLENLKQQANAEPEVLNSMLHSLTDVLRARSARFTENDVTADALRRLERRVASLPKESTILNAQRQPQVVAIRDAVQNEIMREVALVLLEGNEMCEQLLRRTHAQATELRQQLSTQTVENRAEAVLTLVTRHQEQVQALVQQLNQKLRERSRDLVEKVRRRPAFWRRADPTTERALELWEQITGVTRPAVQRVVNRFQSRLNLPNVGESRVQIREWTANYEDHLARLPATYRRLFDTNVVDIADFYVNRPEQEENLAKALAEPRVSILVHGQRGVGKTSLVHHVIDRSEFTMARRVSQIRLSREMTDEGIRTEIANALKVPEGPLEDLLRQISDRPVIVLENADEFFFRTLQGFQRFSHWLDFISRTSTYVSWVVVMRTPTVTMLDTSLGMRDYFTHVLEVPDFDVDGLTELIMKRHRASGFSLVFEEEPTLSRWTRFVKGPQERLFASLGTISHGNPLLAQHLWLSALRRRDDRTLMAEDVVEPPGFITRSLSIDQQHIVAALIRHRAMSITEIEAVLRMTSSAIERELSHLMRLGLVGLHLDLAGRYEVSSLFSMPLEHELQEENVL